MREWWGQHGPSPGRKESTLGGEGAGGKEAGQPPRNDLEETEKVAGSVLWPAKAATNQHPLPCERIASDKSPCWDTANVWQGEGSVCPGSSGASGLLLPLHGLVWVGLALQGTCNSQCTHQPADLC